jgi:endoglucanase
MRQVLRLLDVTAALGLGGCTFRGIDIAGGSFVNATWYDVTGVSPRTSHAGLQHIRAKGINAVRVDFLLERLQPIKGAAFDPTEAALLGGYLDALQTEGIFSILDVHNYGHWGPKTGPSVGDAGFTTAQWKDFWRRLVAFVGRRHHVLGYEVMNEPEGMTGGVAQSKAMGQDAVDAIRERDSTRYIWVPGYHWQKVQGWAATNGTPWVNDAGRADRQGQPLLRYAAHHYFDANEDSSYGTETPPAASTVTGQLKEFTGWCAQHAVKCAITEVGWPNENSGHQAAWNGIAESWFQEADRAKLDVLVWASGCGFGDSELLQFGCGDPDGYVGGAQIDTDRSSAQVTLAHLSP